jgi:GrpB-like predicted nucleotidyltransferase (UPF0157 family)
MTVHVVDYRPEWPDLFEAERKRLIDAIGTWATHIEHVGSTAVPGLAAKPVIDIMPGVPSLAAVDQEALVAAMVELGYAYRQDLEAMMPYRRYFTLSGDNPHHPKGHLVHTHLVEIGSEFWVRHLAFRDYLRAHPDERDSYGTFKQRIAPNFTSTSDYSEAKHEFIQAMQARALAWCASRT